MSHSFRFQPPEPRPDSIVRPRLVRVLLGRWEHRVTTVVGGPGLGKTTLLAQAVAENRLAPRGEDVWIDVDAADAEPGNLGRDLLLALGNGVGGDDRSAGSGRAVADAVWRRAPVEICFVLDNVHRIPAGSPGAGWLGALIDALPANGHVLMASRWALPVGVMRLAPRGALLRLDEDDLRFTDDELAGLAAARRVDVERLAGTGGWPAMAELAASIEGDLAGDYLWEEVLRPLGPERRRTLAVLCDLGGADAELASAALGRRVDLDAELAGVPLIASSADGWRVPHQLWHRMPALRLPVAEVAPIRRKAIDHLIRLGRFDEAMSLASTAGLTDAESAILRAVCVAGARPPASRMARWLALSPPAVRASPAGRLLEALRLTLVAPLDAPGPLQEAAAECRRAGDVEGELVAIANLARVAWWYQLAGPLVELGPRVAELEAAGHPLAPALGALGRALVADIAGDDAAALGALDSVRPGTLDPAWEALVTWLRANLLAGCGDVQAASATAAALDATRDPNLAVTVEGLAISLAWMEGRIEEAVARMPPALARARAAGMVRNLGVMLTAAAHMYAHLGDVERAKALIAELVALGDGPRPGAWLSVAHAAVHLAEGDEELAAGTLAKTIGERGLHKGSERRVWRLALPMSYVLVPDARKQWDAAELGGFNAVARTLAAAVVDARAGRHDRLRSLELPELGTVRAVLHHRFAAELAVGLDAGGHPAGQALLEALGPAGRDVVRALAGGDAPRRARAAKALLAAVPAPPAGETAISVLGPLSIRRNGREVDNPALRRERLRALLAFLIAHRHTTRTAITAALWPDLDDRSAANNLRVTLSYLLRLLEPWRAPGEPSFHIRTAGHRVELVTGDWLRIDVDEFDEHIAAAEQAEADGTPSLALEHNLEAVNLYRGDLHADLPGAGHYDLDRDRYRSRFVAAATRAAELLAAKGDLDAAEVIAGRAIAVDPWAESAYAVLVRTALARGDRAAAQRMLDRCLDALDDLGVEPSEETLRLGRRVRAAS